MKASIKTAIPGPQAKKVLDVLKKKNGTFDAYPIVFSGEGQGCYAKDIDGNTFLDFGSQIASNPLGYNYPELIATIKQYANRSPIKFAGQDFNVKEHADLLEELLSITPKELNAAFLNNSGTEAVENAIKICMRRRPTAKVLVSFAGAFHGRTLGALSVTNSKQVQKKHFFSFPARRLPYNESAAEALQNLINREYAPEEIGCVILEHIQGEGGYNVASLKMIKKVRSLCQLYDIPYIADEVQSGMGRTGEWWAFTYYGIQPDVMAASKALQVGATISHKSWFPDVGAISNTWGGGHILDLALGKNIIEIIKKKKLLTHIKHIGDKMKKRLHELSEKYFEITNVRGKGLMLAFDLPSKESQNNLVIEAMKQGLILIGCGKAGIRLIPPYIITEREVEEGLNILEKCILKCRARGFRHTGAICDFMTCGESVT